MYVYIYILYNIYYIIILYIYIYSDAYTMCVCCLYARQSYSKKILNWMCCMYTNHIFVCTYNKIRHEKGIVGATQASPKGLCPSSFSISSICTQILRRKRHRFIWKISYIRRIYPKIQWLRRSCSLLCSLWKCHELELSLFSGSQGIRVWKSEFQVGDALGTPGSTTIRGFQFWTNLPNQIRMCCALPPFDLKHTKHFHLQNIVFIGNEDHKPW